MMKGRRGQTNQLYAIKLGTLNHAARARHNYYLCMWCGVCMHACDIHVCVHVCVCV